MATPWVALSFPFGSLLTSTQMTNLFNDFTALGERSSGAPPIVGSVIQTVNTQDGEVDTGSTLFIQDDSIPQNDEGDEYMTLAITPKSVNNILKIDVVVNLSHSSTPLYMIAALFQDSTADALAVAYGGRVSLAHAMNQVVFSYYMVAGTISETTFKVRAGSETAGTTTFNGRNTARLFGGKIVSSITITELVVD